MAENTIKAVPFMGFEDLVAKDTLSLQDKFGVPPFSILDTKQGYWQERKRDWIRLGIESELGRGQGLLLQSEEVTMDNGKKLLATTYKSQDSLNSIMGQRKELFPNSKDKSEKVWTKSHNSLANLTERYETGETVTDSVARVAGIGTGTSIFDPVLTELMYRWFAPPEGHILDPFAGGSVRGIVASKLGYKYTGIDLSKPQLEANIVQFDKIRNDLVGKNPNIVMHSPVWIAGNSLNVDSFVGDTQFDLIFSCPPYHDLEVYSDDPEDLSNVSWDKFKELYADIINKCCTKLKYNRFACFVVSEIRGNDGAFKGLVPCTIQSFEKAGLHYYNEIILVNVVGSLPIRVNNQFNGNRKIGRMHQNVLIFYKGNLDNIKASLGEVTGVKEEKANMFNGGQGGL